MSSVCLCFGVQCALMCSDRVWANNVGMRAAEDVERSERTRVFGKSTFTEQESQRRLEEALSIAHSRLVSGDALDEECKRLSGMTGDVHEDNDEDHLIECHFNYGFNGYESTAEKKRVSPWRFFRRALGLVHKYGGRDATVQHKLAVQQRGRGHQHQHRGRGGGRGGGHRRHGP